MLDEQNFAEMGLMVTAWFIIIFFVFGFPSAIFYIAWNETESDKHGECPRTQALPM